MKLRYKIAPQMKVYDRLGQTWLPYLMYFHSPCFTSDAVNTDSRGFRNVYKGDVKLSDFYTNDASSVCLLVGSSSTFGVGASSDRQTIPSLLNNMTRSLWLNFGGRAFSSTQELLLFQFFYTHLKNIKKIVILSGLNNLILYFLSHKYTKEIGSVYFFNQFDRVMNRTSGSLKRRMIDMLLKPFRKEILVPASQRFVCKNDLLVVYRRDIVLWKLLTDALQIELHFVLQPFAKWIDKKLSPEEEELFKELDEIPNNTLSTVKRFINRDLHEWFVEHLKKICGSYGVSFFDMNRDISQRGMDGKWLFIDRSHFTDEGNRVVAEILKERCLLK